MTNKELSAALSTGGFPHQIDKVEAVSLQGCQYPDLFRLSCPGSGDFACKLRKAGSLHIRDSLECLKAMRDAEGLVTNYSHIIPMGEELALVMPWLAGTQPIEARRDALPRFFAALARFNEANPSAGPFTSMYLDSKPYATIEELVASELQGLFAFAERTGELDEALAPLTRARGCIVFEDMNTGNMMIRPDGSLALIDSEYLHEGLALHQFDHLNYFGFDEKAWYNITDEAKDCYAAYSGELGISSEEANDRIRAYETLAVLRKNAFCHYKKDATGLAAIPSMLRKALGWPRFI